MRDKGYYKDFVEGFTNTILGFPIMITVNGPQNPLLIIKTTTVGGVARILGLGPREQAESHSS